MNTKRLVVIGLAVFIGLWPGVGLALPSSTLQQKTPLNVSKKNKGVVQDEIVVYGSNPIKKKNPKTLGFSAATWTSSESSVYKVKASELTKVKEANRLGFVESYSYNAKLHVSVVPNDPIYNNTSPNDYQWGLRKVSAPAAWDVTTGSSDVVIAVIDTGFMLSHSDLSGKYLSGYDFIDIDSSPAAPNVVDTVEEDNYMHGTMVAGIAAATTNNNMGIAGMDWGAKLMPLRVCDNTGSCDLDSVASAIDYARVNGADVINLSLGGPSDYGPLHSAISAAYEAGVTIVAASGNENTAVSYPAAYPEVIAVGATDSDDVRASFSNYGSALDVVAPGVDITSTSPNWNGSSYEEGYRIGDGTSFASPIVSGVVGLLESQNNNTPTENRNLLIGGVDKVAGMGGQNFTNYYGYGRINALDTLGIKETSISLSSFRVVMEDPTTLSDDTDYVYASNPAVGETVTIRTTLRNQNSFPVTLENVRIRGLLDTGTRFTLATVPTMEIPANGYAAVFSGAAFTITSFRTHSFYIDFEYGGTVREPYIKPTYSYQKIKAHFPAVLVTKTPYLSPTTVRHGGLIYGAFKIKNYDSRPAYLKEIYGEVSKSGVKYLFIVRSRVRINPGSTYYYSGGSVSPQTIGTYLFSAKVRYGNSYLATPPAITGVSSTKYFYVY